MKVLVIDETKVVNAINWPDDKSLPQNMVNAEDFPKAWVGSIVENGIPAPLPVKELSLAALAKRAKWKRDFLINAFVWRIQRNESEIRQGLSPAESIEILDAYIQALRDVPQQSGFPTDINWPVEP